MCRTMFKNFIQQTLIAIEETLSVQKGRKGQEQKKHNKLEKLETIQKYFHAILRKREFYFSLLFLYF